MDKINTSPCVQIGKNKIDIKEKSEKAEKRIGEKISVTSRILSIMWYARSEKRKKKS